ncbi:transposase family protein [Francisella halioticida]|uniref:transposase family protein n=1 Tax=Francisella halioticida TaxID=549298 RepID=UPI003B82E02B
MYLGKKKNYTRKNIVACDHDRKALFLSPTKSGRRHDKKLLDKLRFIDNISPDTCICGDTGFKGI